MSSPWIRSDETSEEAFVDNASRARVLVYGPGFSGGLAPHLSRPVANRRLTTPRHRPWQCRWRSPSRPGRCARVGSRPRPSRASRSWFRGSKNGGHSWGPSASHVQRQPAIPSHEFAGRSLIVRFRVLVRASSDAHGKEKVYDYDSVRGFHSSRAFFEIILYLDMSFCDVQAAEVGPSGSAGGLGISGVGGRCRQACRPLQQFRWSARPADCAWPVLLRPGGGWSSTSATGGARSPG